MVKREKKVVYSNIIHGNNFYFLLLQTKLYLFI